MAAIAISVAALGSLRGTSGEGAVAWWPGVEQSAPGHWHAQGHTARGRYARGLAPMTDRSGAEPQEAVVLVQISKDLWVNPDHVMAVGVGDVDGTSVMLDRPIIDNDPTTPMEARHDTTILCVGDTVAEVVGRLAWHDGRTTYVDDPAYVPIDPPGTSAPRPGAGSGSPLDLPPSTGPR